MVMLRLHLGPAAHTDREYPRTVEEALVLAGDVLRADVGIHAVDVLDDARVVAGHVDRCTNCGAPVVTRLADADAEEEREADCAECQALEQRVGAMSGIADYDAESRRRDGLAAGVLLSLPEAWAQAGGAR